MAERRMFSKRLTNSARFIKMPSSTQNLYFHLGLNADDDGVVEAFSIMNQINATEDDLKILAAKGFVVVLNEDLVSYLVDWRENNKLRADRKIDSIYKDLLLKVLPEVPLLESKTRADRKKNAEISTFDAGTSQGQPMDGIGQDRLGKDSDRLDINNKINIFNKVREKVANEMKRIVGESKLEELYNEALKHDATNFVEYMFTILKNEVEKYG